ncbi:restriction endonuclease subunit S [Ruminococcaceae bacterium OttesenSCG-928-O06]|nr:restriction endonuclease subunit S [Ruminococcaceae bacterium OttesenSCG-928-O06]
MQMLSEMEWRERTLEEVFIIGAGERLTNADKINGIRPFVGATDNSNGITGFVGNINKSLDSNVLGVNYNGAPCIAFYHPYECIFTDDVKRLHLIDCDDEEGKLLFFKVIIMQQRSKYSYGYKFKEKRMLRQKLMLPVTDDGEPDYDYMSDYVRKHKEAMLAKYRDYAEKQIAELGDYAPIPALDEKEWDTFSAFGEDGFFEIATTSSSIDGIRIIDGDNKNVPYVTRTDTNNGIARFVSDKNYNFGYDTAGCITVGLDTQSAFWQSSDFVTGQNIQIITSDILNPYLAQFVIPLFRSQMKAKFNWGGNGATLGRMKRLELMLPTNDSGKPDFEYMEQYTKNMMLRKYKRYLEYLNKKARNKKYN